MTARLDPIGSDGPEAALWHASPGDDPLAMFQPESEEAGKGSGDSAALRMDAIPSRAPSVPFATSSVNDAKPRTAGVVNRIKRVLRNSISPAISKGRSTTGSPAATSCSIASKEQNRRTRTADDVSRH